MPPPRRQSGPDRTLQEILDGLLPHENLPVVFTNCDARPTQHCPTVRQVGDTRRVDLLRRGLVPSWAKNPSIGS